MVFRAGEGKIQHKHSVVPESQGKTPKWMWALQGETGANCKERPMAKARIIQVTK